MVQSKEKCDGNQQTRASNHQEYVIVIVHLVCDMAQTQYIRGPSLTCLLFLSDSCSFIVDLFTVSQ